MPTRLRTRSSGASRMGVVKTDEHKPDKSSGRHSMSWPPLWKPARATACGPTWPDGSFPRYTLGNVLLIHLAVRGLRTSPVIVPGNGSADRCDVGRRPSAFWRR